jgi:predicted anti-sigma-YlaC factor YlaD
MTTDCRRSFDESLLSGFLDNALGQQDEQRVRVHLEDCSSCRAQVAELRGLREVALSSRFELPSDDQWDEKPRGGVSRLFRDLGWLLLAVWIVGLAGYGVTEVWTGAASLLYRLMAFGGISAVALLFLSVAIDRWTSYPLDRYREVRK